MTENEAVILLSQMYLPGFDDEEKQALSKAIEALQEIRQYQAIGSVKEIEEILQIISEGQNDVDESGISTGLLHTLLEYAEYKKIGTVGEIKQMKKYSTLAKKHGTIGKVIDFCAEYEDIGTVEECREARERQREKKYKRIHPCKSVTYYQCPCCNGLLHISDHFCSECGQAISWEEEEKCQ